MSHLIFELPALTGHPPAPSGKGLRPIEAGGDAGRDAERLSLCHRETRGFAPDAELASLSLTRSDAVRDDPRRELARLSLSREDHYEPAGNGRAEGRWM